MRISARLTEEMLDNVIDNNDAELARYKKRNPFIDLPALKKCCHIVRFMYYDALIEYVGDIHEEDFYYNIPSTDRRKILDEIKRLKLSKGINKYTYEAILRHSVSSLELLMLEEYENVIEGDCDSVIFSIKLN